MGGLSGFQARFERFLSGFWAVFPGRGPRLMFRLSRQNFSMSRLSRPKLGMSRLERPKHGISRLLRPWWSVATIATEDKVARPKHRDSYLVCADSRNQELPFPDFRDRKTKARLSRPRRIWRDPAVQEMAWPARSNLANSRLSRTRRRRRDFPDQRGDGATQETARIQKQRLDRLGQCDQNVRFQDFRDRGGDGAKKPKGQLKVTQGSTRVKLPYLSSESHGGLNYQISFISH